MDLLTTYQQKALNFNQHISLTANAGSGKTFVLSRRYLEIALSEKGSLRKIAAITFTDKAASELYKKIAEYAELRFNTTHSEEEKKLLSTIRSQLVSANISTIHSFCLDILRQFPVEAGLDANFQPIDEITSDELIELAVEETIKESLSGKTSTEETKYLIRLFGSKLGFSSQLKRLTKDRKKIFEIKEKIYNKSVEGVAEFHYEAFTKTAKELIRINKDEFIKALSAINETILTADRNNGRALEINKLLSDFKPENTVENDLAVIHSMKEYGFKKNSDIRVQGYLSNGLQENLRQQISIAEKYIRELSSLNITSSHKEIERELAKFGTAALQLFDLAVENYEVKKKENGYLDYEDILILTKNLLKVPSVKSELTRRFKFIMVDEYQDTNEIQYKIFLPILDDLKEGNLFVVGDEKQSIYMFRDADLEVFRITKQKISETSGEKFLLSLPDSFRMAPGICLFVNRLFRNLFSDPDPLFNEVSHSDLVCAKQEDTDSLIEIIIGASENNKKDDQQDNKPEAELVAERIISLVSGTGKTNKLNWKDIAVLVRKRKSFSSLEKVFIEKNIPFNIVGGKGFYQRQPVYDIYNYFSFLLDTKNDTALTGILRSPFFNLPDSIIYEVSLVKQDTLWQKLNKYSIKDEKISDVIRLLKANIRLAAVYSAPMLLRQILNESPYLSVLSQKASGSQETANISKLVKLTIDFQSKGFKTLYDYVNFLKESIEETDDEAQAAVADESDSVKVMTLHQAKGLEYPAVFLYNSHEVTTSDKVKKGSIQADKNFGLLTKVPLNGDYFGEYQSAPINNVYDFISSKKETAEIKRLFYVGATRAKNYLFISAPEMDKYRPGSFMSLLQEGLGIDFTKNDFVIRDELQFLRTEEDKFLNFSEILEEKIEIVRRLNTAGMNHIVDSGEEHENRMLISKVTDTPKGEIISATKFAAYKQCPLKYSLMYDLGISTLVRDYRKYKLDIPGKDDRNYEFSRKENIWEELSEKASSIPGEIRGSIVHRILQLDNPVISSKEISSIIREEFHTKDASVIDAAQTDISGKLKTLFGSDIYKRIQGYKKSYNEYEIYLNEEDYFLHGIIDKLIIDGSDAVIIDYKTDSINREEICDRSSLYFPQLKFYSYIVSRFFKELTSFELRLIFINFPGEDVKEIISREEADKSGDEIRSMVNNIRLREFDQNLSHCNVCNFSLINSKCIVERA